MKQNTFAARVVKLAGFALLAAAVLVVMGCFYMSGLAARGGAARASISVGKSIPSGIASVVLVVGGPGMDTIANTYTVGTNTATLTVPSGSARTFTLLANTPSVTFRDDVTVDLAPGETKSITLNPVLAASQIIVPDDFNGRVVQVSDMKGTGWTTLAATSPQDIDFDSQGRLYVAGLGGIIQMDDISGANPTTLTIAPTYVTSIAMDRVRGLLYYTDGSTLYEKQVAPTPGVETLVDLSAIFPVVSGFYSKGIAVDSDGFLYMVTTSPSHPVVKIDPKNTAKPVATYTGTLTTPWDVLVNGNYVYVSDQGNSFSSIQGKIIRLSKNLEFVDEFAGPASDPFLGPERFVAILNKPITVTDRNNSGARLVSFSDMTGEGWTTYGSLGTGQDQFQFYGGSG